MFILSFETAHHISVMNDFFFQKKNLTQSTFLTISHNQSFYNTIFKYYEVYKLTSNSKHKTDKKHEKKRLTKKLVENAD